MFSAFNGHSHYMCNLLTCGQREGFLIVSSDFCFEQYVCQLLFRQSLTFENILLHKNKDFSVEKYRIFLKAMHRKIFFTMKSHSKTVFFSKQSRTYPCRGLGAPPALAQRCITVILPFSPVPHFCQYSI